MSAKVEDIIECMESLAPQELKEDWDNVGLLVGRSKGKSVDKILFALDVNDDVIKEAAEKGCKMIITHHPVIFGAIKNVTDFSPLGERIISLIENDISVFSAHTNFDICQTGTNTILANFLGLKNIENLCDEATDGLNLGKTGYLESEMTFYEFALNIKKILNVSHITVCADEEKKVKKVGLCTGSGANRELLTIAKRKECDVYVTGDLKFHDAQFAKDIGLCVIDATHYATEVISMEEMAKYVSQRTDAQCILSEVNGQMLKVI